MKIKIIDNYWNRYQLYRELVEEIGLTPVKYTTWQASFKKHSSMSHYLSSIVEPKQEQSNG